MDWIPEDKQMDMRQPDGGLLNWIKENPTQAAAVGAITPYAAKELTAAAMRPLEKKASSRVSIMMDEFYAKNPKRKPFGILKPTQKNMAIEHFIANERNEVNDIAKKYFPDLNKLSYRNKKKALIDVAKQYGVTIRPEASLNRAPGNFGELSAVLERKKYLDEGFTSEGTTWQSKKIRKLDLVQRSEHQWQILNKVVHDDIKTLSPFDKARLNSSGISAPTKTTMKDIYGGKHFGTGDLLDHSRGIGGHGRQMGALDTRLSHSKIIHRGDQSRMWQAVNKDHMHKMADYVMKYADLENPDPIARRESIIKHARQKFLSLAGTPFPQQYNSLHWQVGDADKEIQRFVQNFKYNTKTGVGDILISPARKPLPLIGGFQASVRYKRVKTKPKYRVIGNPTRRMDIKYEKYYPNKLKKSYLYTDRLDLLKGSGWTQRLPHLTIMTDNYTEHISDRENLITSLKEKKWTNAAKKVASLGGKALKAGGRFFAFKFARI